jgi:hypothetical protein
MTMRSATGVNGDGSPPAPVILMGMHRSGTSMVTRLLARLGLFIGWEQDANAEAVFFVLRNEMILKAQGARWDDLSPLAALMSCGDLRDGLRQALEREVESVATVSYLGPIRYLKHRSLRRLPFAWGWKDPRNTFLLPLWLEVFPGARVVHVVRNGVEVAASLARREAARRERVLSTPGRTPRVADFGTRPPGVSRSAWWWMNVHVRAHQGRMYRRLGRWRTHQSIDLQNGFRLWTEYLKAAEAARSLAPSSVLEVRYEDVLADPSTVLAHLAAHCRLAADPASIEEAISMVNRDRRSHLQDDPELQSLYDSVRTNEWMRQWGYDLN